LQRTEVVRISDLFPQVLEYLPVAMTAFTSYFVVQVIFEVDLNAIVVDQGIVYIQKENDIVHTIHISRISCRDRFVVRAITDEGRK
jgi:hypothetical protein